MDLSRTLERLNSGMRINSAADDAASLAVATNTETSSRLYGKAIQNLNDGISLTNLASEALDTMTSIVSELQELAGQATSSALNSSQRSELDERAQALRAEYERIRQTTQFNSTPLFPAAESTVNIQAGIRSQSVIPISMGGSGSNTDFEATVTETVYTGQLSSETSFASAGTQQGDIQTADMNGDGVADLVSSGGQDSTLRVRIRLGNGDGTFGAAAEYTLPQTGAMDFSYSMLTGDFDGDGRQDVVAATWNNGNESEINFFKGNADGTLQAAITSSVGLGIVITGMSAGDIDNDGDRDLMVNAGLSPYSVYSMVNNGNGYFTPLNPGLFPVNNRSADDVALADLNGDGNLDVVGGDNLSTIRVSLGNGNGTFGAATSYSGAGGFISDLELGDMDGDGVLDIVSTNGAGSVAFFKGNANGTFQARVAITAPDTPQTIELADVTNDGVLDIIGSGTHSGTTPVFVLVGNGNGTFQAPRTTTSSVNPREIAVGDFDGDGVPDVVGQSYGGNIRVFLSQSSVQTTTSDFSLTTVARAQGAVTLFNTIQDQLTVEKGRTAAAAVRLESGLSNADAMRSLFSDASDRIRDIDAAEELAKYTALSVRSTIQSALFAHIMDGPSILSLLGQ